MNIDRMLSPEERIEREELMERACFDDAGRMLPSEQLGESLHRELLDAQQAMRQWATWMMENALNDGLRRASTQWLKTKHSVPYRNGDVVVQRSAMKAMRTLNAQTNRLSYQPAIYPEMTQDQIRAELRKTREQIASARINEGIQIRLLELWDACPDAYTAQDALDAMRITIDQWLDEDAA